MNFLFEYFWGIAGVLALGKACHAALTPKQCRKFAAYLIARADYMEAQAADKKKNLDRRHMTEGELLNQFGVSAQRTPPSQTAEGVF
jgi:hypothetical protein